jgi:hypothetical protein
MTTAVAGRACAFAFEDIDFSLGFFEGFGAGVEFDAEAFIFFLKTVDDEDEIVVAEGWERGAWAWCFGRRAGG